MKIKSALKIFVISGIISGCFCGTPPQQVAAAPVGKKHTADMTWWKKDRFGMFIHWGLYAVPAGVWHGKHAPESGEWIMNNAHIPRKQYAQLAKRFDPTEFNAARWVQIAKAAGMKYIVITTMHHDGFCMFKTNATHYNVVDDTPWHKDPVAALDKACQQQGIKFCTYYSVENWHSKYQLPHSWNHGHPIYFPTRFAVGGAKPYLKYMTRQLGELIRQYHPALMWFDNSVITPWTTPSGQKVAGWTETDARKIWDYVRKIDPTVIINNRLDAWSNFKGFGDYNTPEEKIPPRGLPGPWETCMTINNTWGYVSWDHNWKSSAMLIHHLIHCASGGGNFLLNVGPTAKGVIPKPEVQRILAMGAWLRVNGAAIYGSHRTPFTQALSFGYATQKPGKLFLEVTKWPKSRTLVVPMHNAITKAYLLADHLKLQTATGLGGQLVYLPAAAPDPVASVVVLDIAGKVKRY
ncbi:MAG: alpha-L-fucosidase [Phycisphaerae bacterium]